MPTANWTRLGELLVRRRIELDPRYSNRRLFCKERGVNYRTVTDIEHGLRGNYEPATVTALEVAYAVVPGSFARAATGEDGLEPLAATEPPDPEVPRNPFAHLAPAEPEDDAAWAMFPDPGDKLLRWIWRLPVAVSEREQLVRDVRARRRAAQNPPGRESAGLAHPDGNVSVTDLNFR